MDEPINTTGTYPDIDLVERAVRNAKNRLIGGKKKPRWQRVMGVLGLGSNYSRQLCLHFELDPDECV